MALDIVSDAIVMPDRYNTGIERGQTLTVWNQTGLENHVSADGRLMIQNGANLATTTFCELIDDSRGHGLHLHNINFDGVNLLIGGYGVNQLDFVEFKNCEFGSNSKVSLNQTDDPSSTTSWFCEKPIYMSRCFGNGISLVSAEWPAVLDGCLTVKTEGDVYSSDNPIAERRNCYAYKCGLGEVSTVHSDYIQSAGLLKHNRYAIHEYFANKYGTPLRSVYVRNCRSDVFQYMDDEGTIYHSNAALFAKVDYDDIKIDVDTMYGNGGSYIFRFHGDASKNMQVYGTANNLISGCIYQFGRVSAYDTDDATHTKKDATHVEYTHRSAERVLIGSIWKDRDSVKISATNYTTSPRTFEVRTNIGSITKTIKASPDTSSLMLSVNDSYDDPNNYIPMQDDAFPYDALYDIPSDGVEYVQIYDDGMLVRTQVLDDDVEEIPDVPVIPEPEDTGMVVVSKSKLDDIADALSTAHNIAKGLTLGRMKELASTPIGITPTGTYNIIDNGEYQISQYEKVNVNVPKGTGGITPTGTYNINANGEYTIAQYEKVNVNVPSSGVSVSRSGSRIVVSGADPITHILRDGNAIVAG